MSDLDRRAFLAALTAVPALNATTALRATQPPAARPTTAEAALAAAVDARIAGFDGRIYLYARNLATGAEYGLRPDERVRTASTIKLPILCALHDLAAQGKVQWDEPMRLAGTAKVAGSGVLRELSDGVTLPLRDVARLMIVVSDNTATNLVLDRIGTDAVNAYLDRIGLAKTRVLRKVRGAGTPPERDEGWSAAGRLAENRRFGLGVSTPREMVALLDRIDGGRIVSPEVSREILAMLARQQHKDGIGRRRASEVASKSGALDVLRSDVGLVTVGPRKLAIAATVDDMPKIDDSPDNVGNVLIADLTELLVRYLG
jgi:beta-lactamase class A